VEVPVFDKLITKNIVFLVSEQKMIYNSEKYRSEWMRITYGRTKKD
jgi:hypothetical protein